MKYKIFIKNPGKLFLIKGRTVRSPFESIIDDKELKVIKSKLKFYGLSNKDYSLTEIEELKPKIQDKKDYSFIPETIKEKPIIIEPPEPIKEKPIIIESPEIITEPIKKPIVKPELIKQKKTVEEKPIIHKAPVHIPKKIIKPEKTIEQINENIVDGVEVKIEELSIKSSSILEKFLNGTYDR
jgi:hypothetical protein